MSVSIFLTSTCSLQKPNRIADGRGGWDFDSPPWVDLLASFKASVQPIPDDWRFEYEKLGREVSHRLYCDTFQGTADIRNLVRDNTCRVVFNGRYFEVLGAVDVAEQERMVRMELRERDEGWKAQ